MGAERKISFAPAMASRWRQRRLCVLVAESAEPAMLRDISASGAFLETSARPPLGAVVELRHPEAGAIVGIVNSLARDGLGLGFDCNARSMAFALAAITADMSRPG